jgi:Uma2 family endonuclease
MATLPFIAPMTVDEFVIAYGDDDRFELIDGEVCEREVNGFRHVFVKNRICKLFDAAGVEKLGFICLVEPSFRLTRRTGVIPDVSVIRLDRVRTFSGNAVATGSPDLPIEVAISDSASILERKVTNYLANGAHSVCIVYPDLESIVVYRGNERRRLTNDDSLEFPDLLPGVSIPVAAVFEQLDETK